jgi:hypothetical protein
MSTTTDSQPPPFKVYRILEEIITYLGDNNTLPDIEPHDKKYYFKLDRYKEPQNTESLAHNIVKMDQFQKKHNITYDNFINTFPVFKPLGKYIDVNPLEGQNNGKEYKFELSTYNFSDSDYHYIDGHSMISADDDSEKDKFSLYIGKEIGLAEIKITNNDECSVIDNYLLVFSNKYSEDYAYRIIQKYNNSIEVTPFRHGGILCSLDRQNFTPSRMLRDLTNSIYINSETGKKMEPEKNSKKSFITTAREGISNVRGKIKKMLSNEKGGRKTQRKKSVQRKHKRGRKSRKSTFTK